MTHNTIAERIYNLLNNRAVYDFMFVIVNDHAYFFKNMVDSQKKWNALKEVTKMITTLIQIKLLEPLSIDKAQEIFASTAPKYRKIQGLIRKYYLLSEDGETAGGVYLWESRKAAEQLYTDDWKEFILQKYGTEPSVTYFNSPVIVDNLLGKISN